MDSLIEHLASVEAQCDVCLRGWFAVQAQDMSDLARICAKPIPNLKGAPKPVVLLRRRYNRQAYLVGVLAQSKTDTQTLQPTIKTLRKITALLRKTLIDEP